MSPTTPTNGIYFYNPSLAASILFLVLYFIPASTLLYQTIRYRSAYLICLPIAAFLEVIGYATRTYSVEKTSSIAIYATSSSLIVMAPLFIAAVDYLLLGRLMLFVLQPGEQKLLGLHSRFVTRIFVGCDIFSFLIQASGSGIAASNNFTGTSGTSGFDLLIAGLGFQLATNLAFAFLVFAFYKKAVVKRSIASEAPEGWAKVFWLVTASITLVMVRSTYRIIEFILGFHGYPFTHEWIFYVLESTPMLTAVSIFCFYFPGKFLPKKPKKKSMNNLEAGSEKTPPSRLSPHRLNE